MLRNKISNLSSSTHFGVSRRVLQSFNSENDVETVEDLEGYPSNIIEDSTGSSEIHTMEPSIIRPSVGSETPFSHQIDVYSSINATIKPTTTADMGRATNRGAFTNNENEDFFSNFYNESEGGFGQQGFFSLVLLGLILVGVVLSAWMVVYVKRRDDESVATEDDINENTRKFNDHNHTIIDGDFVEKMKEYGKLKNKLKKPKINKKDEKDENLEDECYDNLKEFSPTDFDGPITFSAGELSNRLAQIDMSSVRRSTRSSSSARGVRSEFPELENGRIALSNRARSLSRSSKRTHDSGPYMNRLAQKYAGKRNELTETSLRDRYNIEDRIQRRCGSITRDDSDENLPRLSTARGSVRKPQDDHHMTRLKSQYLDKRLP
mmetsp:Transcript_20213/g.40280  ORF Transcript_20213/g.40280 Transcript_20213/m.40280 type:complete len:378 (-) Transcript_20213:56-1189(-)